MNVKSSIVAIHQPNFFPWLGYFDKINRSDFFVILDDAQFPKTGAAWTNRVKLMIGGQPRWVTAPIVRSYRGTRQINEMYFSDQQPWRAKMIRTIEINYGRHPFFLETMDVIEELVNNDESCVAEYNRKTVFEICLKLGIDINKIRRASEFEVVSASNNRLCDLTDAVGGNTYMDGGGSSGYLDDQVFERRGVKLAQQNFLQTIYKQLDCENFSPGLSIIDMAMNIGWEEINRGLNAF